MKALQTNAIAFVLTLTTYHAAATEVTFKATQILLQEEDMQTFQIKDINGDHRLDVIWQTVNGELKYRLQDNQAMVTFDNLAGTKWRMTYDHSGDDKQVNFFTNGGVIEDKSNYQYNIVDVSVTELNQLSFCTDFVAGLNRTRCNWKYNVTEVLPHIMKGVDQRSGETWTAYKLIN